LQASPQVDGVLLQTYSRTPFFGGGEGIQAGSGKPHARYGVVEGKSNGIVQEKQGEAALARQIIHACIGLATVFLEL